MIKKPVLSEVEDPKLRTIFESLYLDLNNEPFIKSEFKFYEMEFKKVETNLKVAHGLNYQPLDVMVLSTIGSAITFDYSKFTNKDIVITTTGPVKVRFLLGRYL